jgi:hypothetical protein
MKTKIQSALKVAENALHSAKMRLPRVMHIEADLLNSISNVRTSEGEILKCSSNTAIVSGVGDGDTISRKLGVSINRSTTRLAVSHTGTLQNIQHILTL